eukprot:3228920-Alexandrium_andersonii.AAC.1
MTCEAIDAAASLGGALAGATAPDEAEAPAVVHAESGVDSSGGANSSVGNIAGFAQAGMSEPIV